MWVEKNLLAWLQIFSSSAAYRVQLFCHCSSTHKCLFCSTWLTWRAVSWLPLVYSKPSFNKIPPAISTHRKKKTQSANSKLLASERERNESLTENQPNSLFVNPPPLPSKYTAIVWWRALFPTRDVTENFHTTIAPIVLRAHKLDEFPFYSTFLQLSFNKKKIARVSDDEFQRQFRAAVQMFRFFVSASFCGFLAPFDWF